MVGRLIAVYHKADMFSLRVSLEAANPKVRGWLAWSASKKSKDLISAMALFWLENRGLIN